MAARPPTASDLGRSMNDDIHTDDTLNISHPNPDSDQPPPPPAAATADRNSYLIGLNKHLQINENMLKKAIDLMEESKLKEFEEEWKQLQDAEDKLKVKRAELVSDHMVMILEAAMSSTD